jgi:two-component system, LuxR family, response regulator FixJ
LVCDIIKGRLSAAVREGASEPIYCLGQQNAGDVLLELSGDLGFRVDSFACAADFLDRAAALPLGCVVADLDALRLCAAAFLERIERAGGAFPLILLGSGDSPLPASEHHFGPVRFLEKPLAPGALAETVLELRRSWNRQESADSIAAARLQTLTKHERDVLSAVTAGMTNKAIARSLRMDIRQVELCRVGLMKTLGAKSLSQLVRLALAGGTKVYR